MICLFNLFDIVFAVSVKSWVLISYFSIYFTHKEADQWRIYITWVSQARKDLLADNFDIWKRHEEVGFIAKSDDSEENKKGSFDMTKVLPLSRWKKEEPLGDEDSDEEDSDYEEVLIPKK